MLVVEAVEVVGDADRVRGNALRPAPGRGVGDDSPGSSASRLISSRSSGASGTAGSADTCRVAGVAEDAGDARVRVLHVVDGVLLRLLRREVDVDLDRLVGAAVDEIPARGVDADLVHELVEEDDVAAPLRHLRLLAALVRWTSW